MGFLIDELPIHPLALSFAERKGLDPLSVAMNGGEEYELVFTYPPEKESRIRLAMREAGCDYIVIGEVTQRKDILYQQNETLISIKRGGWDHFHE